MKPSNQIQVLGDNAQASGSASSTIALACLLVVAAGLRIWVANFQPNVIWADETYQVVEPAHRLVYGTGLIAWEYLVQMRSWIFPGAIAGVLWLGRLLGSGPAFKLIPVQLFMVSASLVPVVIAWLWGKRLDGIRGGLVVGGFVAVWVDLIYIAAHPLSDVIAGDVLMAGLYAGLPLTTRPGLFRLAIAGGLFGLTFALRMQLGPPLLVAAVFACGRNMRAWSALILGGALILIASGCLDWITLGTPFQSIWLNIWLNIVKGVSSDYGAMPAGYYLVAAILLWGLLPVIVIATQSAIGGRCFPALISVVIAIFLTQSLIAHKEWRFIFPALPLLITLCGIAVIKEIRDVSAMLNSAALSNAVAFAAMTIWISISAAVAIGPAYTAKWTFRSAFVNAFALASRQPGLCAVDLVDLLWIETPGSAALPAGVPIYSNRSTDVFRDSAGYNVAVSDLLAVMPRDRYRRIGCFRGNGDSRGAFQNGLCVWRRDGGCVPGIGKSPATNWPPFFLDKDGNPRLDRIQSYLPGHS